MEVSRVKELEREVKELKRANEILLAASTFLRAGAVRHEALCVSMGGERPSTLGRRSGLIEAGGSLIRGTPGRVASGPRQMRDVLALPDGASPLSKVRGCNESEPVVEAS